MFIEQNQMVGQEYINTTRKYLDYLEEHLNNVRKAFQELSEACDGMVWVGDDNSWHTLRHEICYHDVSKFSVEEFVPYRDRFFPIHIPSNEDNQAFKEAWEHHYINNEHHAEFINSLPMDLVKSKPGLVEGYLVHMLVDWTAMGYKFGDTAQQYYETNKHKINLLPEHEKFIYTIFKRLNK